jgi:hypothetical protein
LALRATLSADGGKGRAAPRVVQRVLHGVENHVDLDLGFLGLGGPEACIDVLLMLPP